jgi:pimeloyl-ACP methyl ester carboxylesterase
MSDLPNIVLVHGAWADGSSWSAVIERLQDSGYHVIAPQFPMTSLAADVAGCARCWPARTAQGDPHHPGLATLATEYRRGPLHTQGAQRLAIP